MPPYVRHDFQKVVHAMRVSTHQQFAEYQHMLSQPLVIPRLQFGTTDLVYSTYTLLDARGEQVTLQCVELG